MEEEAARRKKLTATKTQQEKEKDGEKNVCEMSIKTK